MKVARFLVLLLTLTLYSCGKTPSEQIQQLEGYWNIDKVVLPDGKEKEFPFSNHMDFFEIEGNNGKKYRVSPRYDGTMVEYGSPVPFKWEEKDGALTLTYKDGEQSYQQTVTKCNAERLILLHENGTEYYYEAYTIDEK